MAMSTSNGSNSNLVASQCITELDGKYARKASDAVHDRIDVRGSRQFIRSRFAFPTDGSRLCSLADDVDHLVAALDDAGLRLAKVCNLIVRQRRLGAGIGTTDRDRERDKRSGPELDRPGKRRRGLRLNVSL